MPLLRQGLEVDSKGLRKPGRFPTLLGLDELFRCLHLGRRHFEPFETGAAWSHQEVFGQGDPSQDDKPQLGVASLLVLRGASLGDGDATACKMRATPAYVEKLSEPLAGPANGSAWDWAGGSAGLSAEAPELELVSEHHLILLRIDRVTSISRWARMPFRSLGTEQQLSAATAGPVQFWYHRGMGSVAASSGRAPPAARRRACRLAFR